MEEGGGPGPPLFSAPGGQTLLCPPIVLPYIDNSMASIRCYVIVKTYWAKHSQWHTYKGGGAEGQSPPPLAPSRHWKSVRFTMMRLTWKAFFGRKILGFEILGPTGRFGPPGKLPSYATEQKQLFQWITISLLVYKSFEWSNLDHCWRKCTKNWYMNFTMTTAVPPPLPLTHGMKQQTSPFCGRCIVVST